MSSISLSFSDPALSFPAFIIEVKKADSPDADLKQLASEAREQIDGREYDATFRAEG